MPIMCTIQMPEGRSREEINKIMADVSDALMKDLHTGERQVRVSIVELPRNRFMAGGVAAYDMPEFNKETGKEQV